MGEVECGFDLDGEEVGGEVGGEVDEAEREKEAGRGKDESRYKERCVNAEYLCVWSVKWVGGRVGPVGLTGRRTKRGGEVDEGEQEK